MINSVNSFQVKGKINVLLSGPGFSPWWLIFFLLTGCVKPSVAENSSPATVTVPDLIIVQVFQDFIPFGMDPFQTDFPLQNQTSTRILYAAAVAARGNDIFVADTAQRMIFRIDRAQRTLSPFVPLSGGQPTALYLARDLSLYVVDKGLNQVRRYTRDGHLVTTFRDTLTLASPVDVLEMEGTGRVLIADNLNTNVIEYSRAGVIFRTIGQNVNTPPPAGSIAAMAAGRDNNIYLLDSLAREVRVITGDGNLLYSTGSQSLKQPVAMAVDHCQRIYVADQFDNAIHVFYNENPLVVYENSNPGLSGFQLITDLWIDNDFLYVADGPGGKIKEFHIAGACQ